VALRCMSGSPYRLGIHKWTQPSGSRPPPA